MRSINESSEIPQCYVVFGFKECRDPSLLHTTVLYAGDHTPEKEKLITEALDKHLASGFEEKPVNFSTEEMFGKDKDVRVLRSNNVEDFFPELVSALAPFNASEFKDYKPHITTDLPSPQDLTIDRILFQKSEYEPIKTYTAISKNAGRGY